jgi:hypothetical protein
VRLRRTLGSVRQHAARGVARQGNRRSIEFATARLATAAQFIRDMIVNAWLASATAMLGCPLGAHTRHRERTSNCRLPRTLSVESNCGPVLRRATAPWVSTSLEPVEAIHFDHIQCARPGPTDVFKGNDHCACRFHHGRAKRTRNATWVPLRHARSWIACRMIAPCLSIAGHRLRTLCRPPIASPPLARPQIAAPVS